MTEFCSEFDVEMKDDCLWISMHEWNDESTQIDGEIVVSGTGESLGSLDIWSLEDLDWKSEDKTWAAPIDKTARDMWNDGDIFVGSAEDFGATSLLVPVTLTRENVEETLRRYQNRE